MHPQSNSDINTKSTVRSILRIRAKYAMITSGLMAICGFFVGSIRLPGNGLVVDGVVLVWVGLSGMFLAMTYVLIKRFTPKN